MGGYILILIILVLGGVLATVGDRIGSRVGKARLSLFNLRPRKTANVVTVLTGIVISTFTLAILLATNDQLRDGLFRIDSIERQRREAEAELATALKQKDKIQGELAAARTKLGTAQTRLNQINRSLTQALTRQKKTQAQLDQVEASFQQARADLQQFSQQAKKLRAETNRLAAEARQLQAERQRLIAQRNQVQTRLNQANVEQRQLERSVAQSQARLKQSEAEQLRLEQAVTEAEERLNQADTQRTALLKQQSELTSEISALENNRKRLEQNIQALLLGLRQGNIAIRAGQVLAAGVVRDISNRAAAIDAVNQLLREARRTAIELTRPTQLEPNQQVVEITNLDLERLINQISDRKPYVIRLLAAANYLEGENRILVVAQPPVPNQVIFPAGEQVANVSLDLSSMSNEEILERLDYLFTLSNVRAKQSGVLADPLTGTVGSFRQTDLIQFILRLKEYQGTINVAVVAPETVYTSGPLKLELVAFQDQRVIFRSG